MSTSADLFTKYGDFILQRIFSFKKSVSEAEVDWLKKEILTTVAGTTAIFKPAFWFLLLALLEYDWTFSIVEHGRNFSPAILLCFLYDEELAKGVLFTLSKFTRAQLLEDCSEQLNLTTRGGWAGKKIVTALDSQKTTYVGPLRWLYKSGNILWSQLSNLYDQVYSEGGNVNLLLRSPEDANL